MTQHTAKQLHDEAGHKVISVYTRDYLKNDYGYPKPATDIQIEYDESPATTDSHLAELNKNNHHPFTVYKYEVTRYPLNCKTINNLLANGLTNSNRRAAFHAIVNLLSAETISDLLYEASAVKAA